MHKLLHAVRYTVAEIPQGDTHGGRTIVCYGEDRDPCFAMSMRSGKVEDRAVQAVRCWALDGIDAAMNKFNFNNFNNPVDPPDSSCGSL